MLMLPEPFKPTAKNSVGCALHLTAQALHMLRSPVAVNSGDLAGCVSSASPVCTPRNHVTELVKRRLKCIVVTSDDEYFGEVRTVVHNPITLKDIPWLLKRTPLLVASIKYRDGIVTCVLIYNWDTSSGIAQVYVPHVGSAPNMRFRELGERLQRSEPLIGVSL